MAKRNCRRMVERFRAASVTTEQTAAYEQLERSEKDSAKSAAEFLEAIANANVPGIGKITIKKLNTFAKDNGYV